MAGLSFVTTVTKADAELVASRFPQADGVAVPALDGRLRLLGARTGQAGAAQQPGSVFLSAAAPPIA